MNSNDLQNLFAPGCHELLMKLRGELRIKSCASDPYCTDGITQTEALCPSQRVDVAAGGDATRDSFAVTYAHSRLEAATASHINSFGK